MPLAEGPSSAHKFVVQRAEDGVEPLMVGQGPPIGLAVALKYPLAQASDVPEIPRASSTSLPPATSPTFPRRPSSFRDS